MNTRTIRFSYRSLVVFLVAILLAGLTLGAAPAPRLQSTLVASALPGGQLKTGGALEAARGPLFQPADSAPASSSAGSWLPWSSVSRPGGANVNAIAVSGSDVYVGGYFTNPGNNVAKWNGATNTWSPLGWGTSTGYTDVVGAIAVSGSDVYVGGYFTSVGNGMANTSNLAKWNTSTNTWSALGTGVDGDVYAFAVSGSDVYVGGLFTSAGGVANTSGIAKWNSSTNTWSALGTGVTGGVYVAAIAISGGDVYAGGIFDHVGGVAANNIAKWNSSTNTWSALGTGTTGGTSSNNVIALAVSGSDVYVGGDFSSAGGVAASSIAKWNTSTNTWSALGTGVVGGLGAPGVDDIAIRGSEVYAGGVFDHAGGVAANNIAKWDTSTSTWSALGEGTTGSPYGGAVNAIAVSGSDVYVGGQFDHAGGAAAGHLARWNATFISRWSALGTGVNWTVYAIGVSGSDVYAGGNFASVGDVAASNIAKWNSSTNTWAALGTGTDVHVHAIAVSGSDVYVGGYFSNAGTCTSANGCNYIAKWNTSTNTWSALGTGLWGPSGGFVRAIAVSGSDIYVGGDFTDLKGGGCSNCKYIAKWNTLTNTWSALGTGMDAGVYSIAVSGSDVYVGGNFSSAGTCTSADGCNRIAKWNTSTNTWSALDTGVSGSVIALAVSGSDVYAGGYWTSAGNCTSVNGCNHIAKWNSSTNTWSALGTGTTSGEYYNNVSAIAVSGDDVYVGGLFYSAGGVSASRIAKWTISTSTWSTLEYGTDKDVFAITINDSDVYVGGEFTVARACPSGCSHIAKWDGSAVSSNADLSNLVLSSGTLTPAFAAATTAYTASVSASVTSITLTPSAAEAHATIKVNGATVASGSPSEAIALHLGENALTIVVTAQDGTTTRTYTVTVTRGASLVKIYLPLVIR